MSASVKFTFGVLLSCAAAAEGAAATPKAPTPEPSLPWAHFLTLLGLSAWVVAADISQDSFRCGSWQYWASQLSVLVPVVIILGVCRQVLLRWVGTDTQTSHPARAVFAHVIMTVLLAEKMVGSCAQDGT